MTFNRRFTPLTMFILSMNGIIGSAWLFAPMYAAKIAGSGAIIAWLIGGLATALIALCFAEVSVMFPVTGGSAHIPQISHGTMTSFTMTWIAWLSTLTLAPVEVQAILQYASTYFTSLVQFQQDIPVLTTTGNIWAVVLMFLFSFLNVVGYRILTHSNWAFFIAKVGVIFLVIGALIKTNFHFDNFIGMSDVSRSAGGWKAILSAVASGGIAFAFTGFKHGVEMAGETKRSAIAIPLAIVGSVFGCLLLYLGLQIAFIGALQPDMVARGWQHLSFAGDIGPLAGLAGVLGIAWLVQVMFVGAIIGPSGAALVSVTSTARIMYAMSRIGYLPAWLSKLNREGFPVAAIIVNFFIGIFLFMVLSGWQAMVNFLISGMVISYGMGPIALLCMREEFPDKVREFKLPAARLLCLVAFYSCNLFSYWTGWETVSKLAIAMLAGVAIFSLAYLRGNINVKDIGFKSALWIVPYLSGLVLISYFGAFGGKDIIPFGWDFVVIAIFSTAILYLAVRNRATFSDIAEVEQQLTEAPSF